MKEYLVFYSEHTVHEKVFKAENAQAAIAKARSELEDNGWDVKEWETGHGEGGQFDVEEV